MQKELLLRKQECHIPLESIYFGGGSPSLLNNNQLREMIDLVGKHFDVSSNFEITIEVNPDDCSKEYLEAIKKSGINRLSVGIQSFNDKHLEQMHRAHNSKQAQEVLQSSSRLFDNFSVDLIYGIPYSTLEEWQESVQNALRYKPPHISAYALTVEPKTALAHQVKKGVVTLLEEEAVKEQYDYLVNCLEEKGYENYEFSSFAKPNFYAVNNSNYWKGKPYMGIGPAAHSYDGYAVRSWNVAHNLNYCRAIEKGLLPSEKETLSKNDRYNEYVMTRLRTSGGIALQELENKWDRQYVEYLNEQAAKHVEENRFYWEEDCLKVSKQARFLSDGLAADLFLPN